MARVAFLLLMMAGLLSLMGCGAPELPSDAAAEAENPLDACPDAPNCVRISLFYDAAPEALFEAAQQAVDEVGASSVAVDPEVRRLDATFRAFVFTDDVTMAVTTADDRSMLHIRSASRVGYDDLGVNSRRVARVLEALDV
ncbi:MAG: DUF1499 domain-containing protein [Bacteroidetes bacterium]|jgi:uncharacterized protein (DUF1499 family)|nr:DUF1499 domain-containing protein [Bacteroidota bacterium]